jgi:hypothetical protein|nr:MAG TPA: putative protease [Caudoviricetes sp.]
MDIQNNDMNTGTDQQTPQNTPTDNQQTPQGAEAQGNQNQQTPQGESNPSGGTLLSGAGKATGAPDTYDFTASLPEGMELDQDTADSFGELARGMNLTNDQANELAKFGYDWAGKVGEAYQKAQQEEADANAAAAMKELGKDFEPTVARAGVLMNYLERQIPGIRDSFAGSAVFSSLPMLKAFALLGDLISEDGGIKTNTAAATKEDNPYPNTDWESLKR